MTKELQARSQLPPQVAKVLAAMPKETHPMTQLSQAVLALQVGGGHRSAPAWNCSSTSRPGAGRLVSSTS